jgi:hypothetical protein
MKTKMMQLVLLATVAPMLAACGSNGGVSAKAPFADIYKASYAEEGKTIGSVLSGPGKTMESLAVSATQYFGDGDVVGQTPGKLIVEYLDTGGTDDTDPVYKITYGGASVTFTRADLEDGGLGGWLEKIGLTTDNQERTIAYIYSLDGSSLEPGDQIMIPVGYGLRLKRDGTLGSADSASAFVDGFSIIGLETKPEAMPKDRTASYEGGANFALRNKQPTEGEGIDEIRFGGSSEMQANFSTGKLTGTVSMTEARVEDYGYDPIQADISDAGAKILLSGDIVSNGFTLDMETNAAADDVLSEVGITDLTAEGAGRFYGTNAEALGALVTGSSTGYVLNGVIWAEELSETN